MRSCEFEAIDRSRKEDDRHIDRRFHVDLLSSVWLFAEVNDSHIDTDTP